MWKILQSSAKATKKKDEIPGLFLIFKQRLSALYILTFFFCGFRLRIHKLTKEELAQLVEQPFYTR